MVNIFTKEQANKIIDMYKENIDVDSIMIEFNTNEHYIREVLKEYQVDRQYNTFSEELTNRIIFLYQNKFRIKDICYALLVSDTGITKTLKRNNIPKRTCSENNIRYSRNRNYFDNINSPNKAYILGLIYADGCNHREHNSLTISLQEEDKDLLERVKDELEYEGNLRLNPLREKNENYKNQYILCINDEYISEQLEKLGVVNSKSLVLKFPTFLNETLYSHFLRGYFDGDGCIYYDQTRNKNQVHITGTYEFCLMVSNILNMLDCKHNIYHPKQSGENNTYVLRTCGNKSSYILLSWMYKDADIKMNRKYRKYLDFCNIYLTI